MTAFTCKISGRSEAAGDDSPVYMPAVPKADPSKEHCVIKGADGKKDTVYSLNKNYDTLRNDNLDAMDKKFKELIGKSTSSERHPNIACLLSYMLHNINETSELYNTNYKDQETKKTKLRREQDNLERQESVIRSNENSGLVTDYRNEETEKITKKLNTYFTLYVTFIVLFLVVEGILFFV